MSKVMFFAHDPGGANAIAPLADAVAKEHKVFVFAKGPALGRLKNAQELPESALKTLTPELLVTGTSANDLTERALWLEARSLGIKSIAIVDHWVNYGIRFSKYRAKEIDRFHQDPDIFPDFIVVMDDFAKGEMIKDGVPEGIIRVLGNPHFEYLKKQAAQVKNVRPLLASRDEFLVIFLSESYTEDFGQGNEKLALRDLMDFSREERIKVMIKLHPKEKREKYTEYPDSFIVPLDISMPELLTASDLVVSMTSMGLIEAWAMGKKLLSYQPGEVDKAKIILTRNGAIPFINSKEEFFKSMKAVTQGHLMPACSWTIDLNGIQNNIRFINEVLCPS